MTLLSTLRKPSVTLAIRRLKNRGFKKNCLALSPVAFCWSSMATSRMELYLNSQSRRMLLFPIQSKDTRSGAFLSSKMTNWSRKSHCCSQRNQLSYLAEILWLANLFSKTLRFLSSIVWFSLKKDSLRGSSLRRSKLQEETSRQL